MRSMTKRILSSAIQTALDFKGFDDLVELFKAGEQTDSLGNTRTFTTDDLDDMVTNHEPFPIVSGHPKTDDPAYGWSSKLVRDGDSLFGQFGDVDPDFSNMVENKRFPNRSVRLSKTENGFAVAHVGFLGAAAPAVKGLKQVEFSEDTDGFDFEFSSYTDGIIARILRRIRESLIAKESLEVANEIIPEWELEALAEDAARERIEENKSDSIFNKHQNNGGADVPDKKEFTQADLDKAISDANKSKDADYSSATKDLKTQLGTERKTRLTAEYTSSVNGWVEEGKLTPAMAAGAVDFMLQLDSETEFEFSQGEGDKETKTKTNGIAWFKDFIGGLGNSVSLGAVDDDDIESDVGAFNAPAGSVVDVDRAALEVKANAYMQKHDCDFVQAVVAVGG